MGAVGLNIHALAVAFTQAVLAAQRTVAGTVAHLALLALLVAKAAVITVGQQVKALAIALAKATLAAERTLAFAVALFAVGAGFSAGATMGGIGL